MKKYRMRPIKSGRNVRMSYASGKTVLNMPNLVSVQLDSYNWFLNTGIREAFKNVFPISRDHWVLDFTDYQVCRDEIKYSVKECKERGATYAAPLRAKFRLYNSETGEQQEHTVYMGDLPLMTRTGTFIINGTEKVVVSQLVRSPGVYFTETISEKGNRIISGEIMPERGEWMTIQNDEKKNFLQILIKAREKTPKVNLASMLRAFGLSSDDEIRDMFGKVDILENTIHEDAARNREEGLVEWYRKIAQAGRPTNAENAERQFHNNFFDVGYYNLGKAGRFKFNKKLGFRGRIEGFTLAEDVVDPMTGEVLYAQGEVMTHESADAIQNAGVLKVVLQTPKRNEIVVSNLTVDIRPWIEDRLPDTDPEELGIHERVYLPVLQELLDTYEDDDELKRALEDHVKDLIPRCITREDFYATVSYELNLECGVGSFDVIDHLANRRMKCVGELLYREFENGLTGVRRAAEGQLATKSDSDVTISSLITTRTVSAQISSFFNSHQLSQQIDQNNPLSALAHKRRLSALGPGGLDRKRAGFEVRDVHYTHYGRLCPVETPEGSNIGLINSLASYARVNEYGFIEAPYRRVDHSVDPENPVVTDEVVYMTADQEDNYIVAQASEELDENNHFKRQNVAGRHRDENSEFPRSRVDFMDVSPRMVFSIPTSMIPFLQNDDATRALMGSNMQRQAVPLLVTDAPIVDTGLAEQVAVDSGACVVAEHDGVVTLSSSELIRIQRDEDGLEDEYKIEKFERANSDNCMNQRPIVYKGDHVRKGEVIADGASTSNGELALGKNPLIGFTTWEGYNYEDAVLLSENLVRDDVYTSIHIEELKCDQRRIQQLGSETITRDLPQMAPEALKNLDADGIIRIGAEVHPQDILVGKVTPKGDNDMSTAKRLAYAILGIKAQDQKNTSLKVPHGSYGIVMDVKVYDREKGDELPDGVEKSVHVYIAQKRKISVGDKMAGRHGNKGVVSRILPVEDMPFLPNGRPLDICLNPLGVPSRMNIGQVMELHLGLAAEVLGMKISTPIFDGAKESDITALLEMANDYANTDWETFKAKYEKDVDPEVMDYLYQNRDHRKEWKGVPIDTTGKVTLRDGRTGEEFPSKIAIGFMHYLKLHHLVDDKIHARATGPYTTITQQPLGGKAQRGGQRFGEMEVWALEAYGAAYNLREMMTIKSDDMKGRNDAVTAIWEGRNLPEPGVPAAFKVLLKELQALCLDVKVLAADGSEVNFDIEDYTKKDPSVIDTEREKEEENERIHVNDVIDFGDLSSGRLSDSNSDNE